MSPWTADASGNYAAGQVRTPPDPPASETSEARRERCRLIDGGQESAEVCEDWTMIVHTPKHNVALYGASLMDAVVWGSNPASGLDDVSLMKEDLQKYGAVLYDPQRGVTTVTGPLLAFAGTASDAEIAAHPAFETPRPVLYPPLTTTGAFFEELVFPMPVLAKYRKPIEVCINDGAPRSRSVDPVTGQPLVLDSVCLGHQEVFEGTKIWVPDAADVPAVLRASGTADPAVCPTQDCVGVGVARYVPYVTQSVLLES